MAEIAIFSLLILGYEIESFVVGRFLFLILRSHYLILSSDRDNVKSIIFALEDK